MIDLSLEQKPAVEVNVSRVEGSDTGIPLPAYETAGAAGMDLRANLDPADRASGIVLAPGARALVPTGLIVEVPVGYEMQVRPRSGLALKHGITLPNSPGTIDSDYRGPLGVIVMNAGQEPFTIAHGDRIAQLVLAPVARCAWFKVGEASKTSRGSGGFGSTGV